MQFQDFVEDQVFSPTLITKVLRTTKSEIAAAHWGWERMPLRGHPGCGARKTQARLRQMLEILNRVETVTGSPLAAYAWFRAEPAAEQGNAHAQNNLGVMYRDGRGVEQEHGEAVRWFRRSAEQGHAGGQTSLGAMYGTARGVYRDDTEAVRWYRLAAEQGHVIAQYNLGVMYGAGRGVERNDAEAVRWYRRAAQQGDVDAQYNLGVLYETGRGVQRDRVEAVRWYRLAAEQGDADARQALDRLR